MMPPLRHRQTANRLLSLLMRERTALLAGRLGDMNQISPSIGGLCDMLEKLPPTRDAQFLAQLEAIKSQATRNQMLAESCARGVRTVTRIQAEAATARKKLSTYTNTGARRDYVANATTRDRRT